MLFGSNAHLIMLLNLWCFDKMLEVILSVFIAKYVWSEGVGQHHSFYAAYLPRNDAGHFV